MPPPSLLDIADTARPQGDGRAFGGAIRRLSSSTPRAHPISRRRSARRCAAAPDIRPCSATRLVTRFLPSWSAGSARREIERFLRGLYRGRQGRRPEGPRHVRQLPDDRIPPSCRSSICSASTSTSRRRSVSRRIWRGSKRSPAIGRCLLSELGLDSRATARDARRGSRLAGRGRPSRPARPAPSCSPGPTSGTAAATRSTTGSSASPTGERRPKPALQAVRAALTPRHRSRVRPGRGSRSSSAPTTDGERSATAWRAWHGSTYPELRSHRRRRWVDGRNGRRGSRLRLPR